MPSWGHKNSLGTIKGYRISRCSYNNIIIKRYIRHNRGLPAFSMGESLIFQWGKSYKTNRSRFFSAASWFQEQVSDCRVTYLLRQTKDVRGSQADSTLIFDDTLCEHVGRMFDYVDHHYNHGDATYPLAHKSCHVLLCQWPRAFSRRPPAVLGLRKADPLGRVCPHALA
jgi:hypothetical protein